jgi:hypothetical protein
MTSKLRWLLIASGVLMLAGLDTQSASARSCYWDGSSPFCEGRCQRGYQTMKVKACFSGFKVYCCERMGSTSQGQKRRR